MLIPMKRTDIAPLRHTIWAANKERCPILKQPVPFDKTALDHIHKLKSIPPSPTAGVVRNALEFRANSFEGKILNNYKRLGLDKVIALPTLLRNIADYLEQPAYTDSDGNYYIHPNEVPKRKKTRLIDYKRICKYWFKMYPNKKVLPKRPTYVTEQYTQWLEQANGLNK